MASNVTQHYQLCQWEPGDKVERLDFNSDNGKIDAAIRAAADLAQHADQKAAAAYTPENSPFSAGWYTGDGAETQVISLGFTPKAVLVATADGRMEPEDTSRAIYGGLALAGHNAAQSDSGVTGWVTAQTGVMIVEGGFQVSSYTAKIGGYTYSAHTNDTTTSYHYVAFR